jgi:outer membrane PBP1 activator LpoA protein
MKRRLSGAAVTLLVAGLTVAGCGGGDDDKQSAATTSTPAAGVELTKAQYVTRADRACTATTAKIETAAAKLRAAAEKSGTIPVPQVTRFLTKTSLPAYEEMLAQLRALKPPKQDEKTIDGLIAALASAIDTAKADPVKYSKNGSPDPFDDANKRAIDYGLKACGS